MICLSQHNLLMLHLPKMQKIEPLLHRVCALRFDCRMAIINATINVRKRQKEVKLLHCLTLSVC